MAKFRVVVTVTKSETYTVEEMRTKIQAIGSLPYDHMEKLLDLCMEKK